METITQVIKNIKVGHSRSKLIAIDGDVYVVNIRVSKIIKKDVLLDGHTNPSRNPEVKSPEYYCTKCGSDKAMVEGEYICVLCDPAHQIEATK